MSSQTIIQLDQNLDSIAELLSNMRAQNKSLQQHVQALRHENNLLLNKNQATRDKIRKILTQLKEKG